MILTSFRITKLTCWTLIHECSTSKCSLLLNLSDIWATFLNLHFSWILSHIDLISINKKISLEDYLHKTILPIALMYDDRKNKGLENKRSRNLNTHYFMYEHIYRDIQTYMHMRVSTYAQTILSNWQQRFRKGPVVVGGWRINLYTRCTFLYNTKLQWTYDLL